MNELETHLADARQALADEDLHGTLAWIELYLHALDAQPAAVAAEVLSLYASVLAAWTGEDAAALAREAAADVDDAAVLHRLGTLLVENKELLPALGVLRRAARLVPDSAAVHHEIAAAHELMGDYAGSAAALTHAPAAVRALPLTIYLHAFARFMARDPGPARAAVGGLVASPDARIAFMGARLRAMLARHDALVPRAEDVLARARAWHATWSGEAAFDPLGTLGPGAAAPATLASVRRSLEAVRDAVATWQVAVAAVTAPPDRDSEILGRALAEVLGVPFDPSAAGPAVTAVWDLGALDAREVAGLKPTAPGRLLYVYAGRGEVEAPLAADLVGRLVGPSRAPWGHDFEVYALAGEPTPDRDARPLATIAADVVRAVEALDASSDDGWTTLVARLGAVVEDARPAGLSGLGPRGRRFRQPAG